MSMLVLLGRLSLARCRTCIHKSSCMQGLDGWICHTMCCASSDAEKQMFAESLRSDSSQLHCLEECRLYLIKAPNPCWSLRKRQEGRMKPQFVDKHLLKSPDACCKATAHRQIPDSPPKYLVSCKTTPEQLVFAKLWQASPFVPSSEA